MQRGLVAHGPGTIGMMLFLGELGGLAGAFMSGSLAGRFRHALGLCALAALACAVAVAVTPLGNGSLSVQAAAYWIFAFGRDLMLAPILGSAMTMGAAARRGSLNAVRNAVYQVGATSGGLAGTWLYGLRTDFAAILFAATCGMLRRIAGNP